MTTALDSAVAAAVTGQGDIYAELFKLHRSNALEDIAISLAKLDGNGFDLISTIAAAVGPDMRKAQMGLLPAVGHLATFDLSRAVALLDYGNRYHVAAHFIVEQLAKQFSRHPDLPDLLLEHLQAANLTSEVVARILAGAYAAAFPLRAADVTKRLALLTPLTSSAILLAGGIILFLDLDTLTEQEQDDLAARFYAHRQLLGAEETVWRSLVCLAARSSVATRCVLDAISSESTAVSVTLANTLNASRATTFGNPPISFGELAEGLTLRSTREESLRVAVDQLLASRLYVQERKGDVLPCLAILRTLNHDLGESYPETTQALILDASVFGEVITSWLLASGTSLLNLQGLLLRCMKTIPLDIALVAQASHQDRMRLVRRIMALVHFGATICDFARQFAEEPKLQPKGREIAAAVLETVVLEFPGAAEKFLKERTRPNRRLLPGASLYRGVYARTLWWRRMLEKLPEVPELRPTESQRFALRMVSSRRNRNVTRAAEQHSIFSKLTTPVHIKQGSRAATQMPMGQPQIVELKRVEHTIELPESEISDPLGALVRRQKLLQEAQ